MGSEEAPYLTQFIYCRPYFLLGPIFVNFGWELTIGRQIDRKTTLQQQSTIDKYITARWRVGCKIESV